MPFRVSVIRDLLFVPKAYCILTNYLFMSVYIYLSKVTPDGLKNARELIDALRMSKDFIKEMGGKWLGWYQTFGEYDFVVILELPSDEAAMIVSMRSQENGWVKTTTMKGLSEDEVTKLLVKL